jgi:uncharacterized protein YeaO (DUF488 family)
MSSADHAEQPRPSIRLRRAYEPPGPDDGQRILVDRVWPRGVTKADARLAAWLRDVAPSSELRRWFGHDPARWPEFERRYRAELAANPEAIAPLLAAARTEPITLVYGARDEAHNQAVVLRDVLAEALAADGGEASGRATDKEQERGAD